MFCSALSLAVAQKVMTVKGEATYYAREYESLEVAKKKAEERARIQALADAFGTTVSQVNTVRTKNRSGKSDIDFSSIGETEVKGEWLGETKAPVFSNPFYENGILVITCKVEGRAMEIVNAELDLQVHVLRNGTEDRFEDTDFRSGDDLFLSFQSPVSGYLAVYLVDDSRQAFCLLPYRGQTMGIYPIEANQHYLFFREQSAPIGERQFVDEYTMTCEGEMEHNEIYVIFSPNEFTKAADVSENVGLPRQLSFEDFNRWLIKCRRRDKGMNVRRQAIIVSK
jgi:hypothetical protein